MTLHLTRYFGFHVVRYRMADGRQYLCAVVWFYRGHNRLGYLYPAVRFR